jgi:hypothetical protein
MSSTYVIIYVNLGSSIQERIAIGMMMASHQKGDIRFSEFKIEWLKKLLHTQAVQTINLTRKNLRHTFSAFTVGDTFDLTAFLEWCRHLHRHSNNLIGISEPIPTLLPCDEASFEEIFNLEVDRYAFLNKNLKATAPPVEFNSRRVLQTLKAQAANHLTFNYRLTPEKLTSLMAPVTLPFAGENKTQGTVVTGHVIDFTSDRMPSLYLPLVNLIHETIATENLPEPLHFIISPEPAPKDSNFPLWSRMQDYAYIRLVTPECLDTIVRYAVDHNLQPELTFGR